jgi:penicillin amidase
MRRLLLLVLSVLLLTAVAAGGLGVYLIRRAFPAEGGTLTVEGLRAPVEVIRDRWGVPHLFAREEHDLFFAQGFVHAQDRLWQMELNRRVASGRLSEIFGATTLETDRFLRTVGLRRAALAE